MLSHRRKSLVNITQILILKTLTIKKDLLSPHSNRCPYLKCINIILFNFHWVKENMFFFYISHIKFTYNWLIKCMLWVILGEVLWRTSASKGSDHCPVGGFTSGQTIKPLWVLKFALRKSFIMNFSILAS